MCDDSWDDAAAHVVCQTFNKTGVATRGSQYGETTGNLILSVQKSTTTPIFSHQWRHSGILFLYCLKLNSILKPFLKLN